MWVSVCLAGERVAFQVTRHVVGEALASCAEGRQVHAWTGALACLARSALRAACALATRAMGTRKGEQET